MQSVWLLLSREEKEQVDKDEQKWITEENKKQQEECSVKILKKKISKNMEDTRRRRQMRWDARLLLPPFKH